MYTPIQHVFIIGCEIFLFYILVIAYNFYSIERSLELPYYSVGKDFLAWRSISGSMAHVSNFDGRFIYRIFCLCEFTKGTKIANCSN